MAIPRGIEIEGLVEYRRNLKKLDSNLPKALRLAFNDAANIVVSWARPQVPRKTGRARASLKSKSTQSEARVFGGSPRVSYFPWLDFGGRVGRRDASGNFSVKRPYRPDGRYIYEGYYRHRDEIAKALEAGLINVARQAGIEVD